MQRTMKKESGRGSSEKAAKGKAGKAGKTNWAKVAATKDRDIRFTKDAPRTSPDDWANAVAHRGV